MNLRNIKFTQAVRIGGTMRDSAPEGVANAYGVLVEGVLVPWHGVRYADAVEADGAGFFREVYHETVDGKSLGDALDADIEAQRTVVASLKALPPKRGRRKRTDPTP